MDSDEKLNLIHPREYRLAGSLQHGDFVRAGCGAQVVGRTNYQIILKVLKPSQLGGSMAILAKKPSSR